jgi:hypothetical protein
MDKTRGRIGAATTIATRSLRGGQVSIPALNLTMVSRTLQRPSSPWTGKPGPETSAAVLLRQSTKMAGSMSRSRDTSDTCLGPSSTCSMLRDRSRKSFPTSGPRDPRHDARSGAHHHELLATPDPAVQNSRSPAVPDRGVRSSAIPIVAGWRARNGPQLERMSRARTGAASVSRLSFQVEHQSITRADKMGRDWKVPAPVD